MSETETDVYVAELSAAIRLACSRSAAGAPPVLAAFSGDAPDDAVDLMLPRGIRPEEAADSVTRTLREKDGLTTVGVESLGVWTLTRPAPDGRLAGKIVIVTGGAQGFGKGIAKELAAEGARVVLADINEAGGQAAAEALNARHGDTRAVFSRTDVTDLASIRACVHTAARTFGGVDIFISNAGVLKAGGLDDMDEQTFDFVTRVNYKGFFLCAKAVTPLMKFQHRIHPEHVMDLIEINSKSGLQGSNRNFAYAGGKFGGIGLTQSFALELAPYGIKVNAVCPGNYFDGPLWSDPERGLFVQYLKAGKVEGARTVEDVRRFYLSKVPLGRGCLPKDVAIAIRYLHEQTYETGQALPVTGGQVMLH